MSVAYIGSVWGARGGGFSHGVGGSLLWDAIVKLLSFNSVSLTVLAEYGIFISAQDEFFISDDEGGASASRAYGPSS